MTTKHSNVALFVPHAGCPHRCSFCDQRAISGHAAIPTAAEIQAACERAIATRRTHPEASEIAFFGGSFTALPAAEQEALLGAAYPFVQAGHFHGIRLSTRPDCVDEGTIKRLLRFGVTAVELGAQSMDDRVLTANFRGHTAADVERAAACIREAGLTLGLQMMTGLYGDTDEGAMDTARRLCALRPATLRIYPTQVLPGTYLARLWERGDYHPATLDEAVALCARLLDYVQRQGVRVIRLGLHADTDLQAKRLAGPYHPAFRELCEGQLYLNTALAVLKRTCPYGGAVTLTVAPAALSKMIGQKRANLAALEAQGYFVTVKTHPDVPLYAVRPEI